MQVLAPQHAYIVAVQWPKNHVILQVYGHVKYRWKAIELTFPVTLFYQGSQLPGKSWKTWKMKNAFSRPGKVVEFDKKAKIMENSWNFQISIWKKILALWAFHPIRTLCLG